MLAFAAPHLLHGSQLHAINLIRDVLLRTLINQDTPDISEILKVDICLKYVPSNLNKLGHIRKYELQITLYNFSKKCMFTTNI